MPTLAAQERNGADQQRLGGAIALLLLVGVLAPFTLEPASLYLVRILAIRAADLAIIPQIEPVHFGRGGWITR